MPVPQTLLTIMWPKIEDTTLHSDTRGTIIYKYSRFYSPQTTRTPLHPPESLVQTTQASNPIQSIPTSQPSRRTHHTVPPKCRPATTHSLTTPTPNTKPNSPAGSQRPTPTADAPAEATAQAQVTVKPAKTTQVCTTTPIPPPTTATITPTAYPPSTAPRLDPTPAPAPAVAVAVPNVPRLIRHSTDANVARAKTKKRTGGSTTRDLR